MLYSSPKPKIVFPLDWSTQLDDVPGHEGGIIDFESLLRSPCDTHSGIVLCEVNGFKIIFCEECDFVHVLNPPNSEILSEFYHKKFYNLDRKKDYFIKQKKSLSWWNRLYTQRLDRFEKILGRKGAILDIGCGPGFFLDVAENKGWEVMGLEPSSDAVDFAKNELSLCVYKGSLSEFCEEHSNLTFDIIYSHGVLEHIASPSLFISLCKSLLTKDGHIFTSVANDFNPIQYISLHSGEISHPWWIVPPEHLNYFSVQSLVRLFVRNNLSIIDTRCSFPIDIFLLSGLNYVDFSEFGQTAQTYREKIEASFVESGFEPLLDLFNKASSSVGIGRQVDVIVKPYVS